MALSKIKGTVIADDAINADRIADGTVIASDLLDNTITGAKLATDIAISTSGNITTTGAFTSTGIDDNATSTAITIDSSNNVGIGTSSPSFLTGKGIAINGGGGQARIALKNNLTGDGATDGFQIGVSAVSGNAFLENNEATAMAFINNGSERMRIDSSGNVGIGTSSPSRALSIISGTGGSETIALEAISGATDANTATTFRLTNSTGFGSAAGAVELKSLRDGSGTGSSFVISSSTASSTVVERMRIDSSGNVGIGTSSPDVALMVDGQIKAVDSTVDLRMNPLAAANVGIVGTYSNHGVVFHTNASEKMRINSSGNVGIGISSPSCQLDIREDGTGSLTKRVQANIDLSSVTNLLSTDPTLFVQQAGTGSAGVVLKSGTVDFALRLDSSGNFIFDKDTTERMRIDGSGSVGIGTTAPFNSRPGSLTVSNDAPTIYLEDTNASGREVGQILYQDTNLTFTIGDRNGTGTTNSIELLKINNAGKIFTRQTAQFHNCVTIGGAVFTGDFQIEISGLTTVNGNAHRKYGMRLSYASIAGNATDSQQKDVLLTINGLTSWSGVTPVDTGGGTIAVTVDSATSTAVTFTVTTPGASTVGAYVATLFANDDSTMECNG